MNTNINEELFNIKGSKRIIKKEGDYKYYVKGRMLVAVGNGNWKAVAIGIIAVMTGYGWIWKYIQTSTNKEAVARKPVQVGSTSPHTGNVEFTKW